MAYLKKSATMKAESSASSGSMNFEEMSQGDKLELLLDFKSFENTVDKLQVHLSQDRTHANYCTYAPKIITELRITHEFSRAQ
eukprot:2260947-Amphidinium_carterae.1